MWNPPSPSESTASLESSSGYSGPGVTLVNFQYNSAHSRPATPYPADLTQAHILPVITPERQAELDAEATAQIVAENFAQLIGEECSGFCQDESMSRLLMQRYTEHATKYDEDVADIEPFEINEKEETFFTGIASPTAFMSVHVTVQDCRALFKAWEKTNYTNEVLEKSFFTLLNLCCNKIYWAAKRFAAFYNELGIRVQQKLEADSDAHIYIILKHAGYIKDTDPILDENQEPDDIPEEYICPVLGTLMKNPIKVGAQGIYYTYEESAIQRILEDKADEKNEKPNLVCCPISRRLLSTLTIMPDEARLAKIQKWQKAGTLEGLAQMEEWEEEASENRPRIRYI